ncbi:hypothetical protein QBC37DRAFT_172013 [Rhypophila decipiens]|uniref:Uncharacterized protein n=1 Tax=Rhypophila decipiens TaxID=261697 RepID=A0AAN6Y6D5_9PEZI|nr:hypothetical protein QBC37DRAFT_172013 [Rhypophila decipiens]
MVSKPDQDQDQGERHPQQGEAGEQFSTSGVLPLAPPPQYSSSSATAQAAEMTSLGYGGISITRDATPCPGERFIIVHKPSNRSINIDNGDFRLLKLGKRPYDFSQPTDSEYLPYCDRVSSPNNTHNVWLCVERNGWLGFRGLLGRYIGQSIEYGNRHNLEATATHHQAWEYFCARRHPRGGYTLLSPIEEHDVKPWLCKLFKLEAKFNDDDGSGSMVLSEDGGSLWEFLRVDGIC